MAHLVQCPAVMPYRLNAELAVEPLLNGLQLCNGRLRQRVTHGHLEGPFEESAAPIHWSQLRPVAARSSCSSGFSLCSRLWQTCAFAMRASKRASWEMKAGALSSSAL